MIKYFIAFACAIESGIYLTQLDFENGVLSYSTAAKNEKNKIRFNEIVERLFISIRHNSGKIVLFKDNIYAYRKRDYRSNAQLRIIHVLEPGVVWIFYKDITAPLGKGIKRERKYYYAVSGTDNHFPKSLLFIIS
ncbi:MAG TPA: hypothetical protein VKA49_20810 [Flavitalea sp.]|nr:hypothetical protein [Flavitalea sp.]